MSVVLIILGAIAAIFALTMLVAKSPVTSALCLLGILIMTAGIYAVIGEHLIATIQLVVYAGAIMVLFIFSIMLLNLSHTDENFQVKPVIFYPSVLAGLGIFGFLMFCLNEHFAVHFDNIAKGPFDAQMIQNLGGNSKVLAHSLFSQFYVSFEVISLALLIAVVGAVVLAKRKFD